MTSVLQSWLAISTVAMFALVLARMAGLVATAPVFASRQVPIRFRAALAVGMALVVTPLQATRPSVASGFPDFLLALGSEALVGLTLGLGVALLFAGVRIAGQLISQMGVMQMADIFSPASDENVPVVSELMYLTALAAFLIAGGHRKVIVALLDTFESLPPGGGVAIDSIANLVATLGGQSFALGVRAASPVVAALLLATLVIGLMARSLPQLNTAVAGLSLHAMIVLSTLAISLGAAVWVFDSQIDPLLECVVEAIHG